MHPINTCGDNKKLARPTNEWVGRVLSEDWFASIEACLVIFYSMLNSGSNAASDSDLSSESDLLVERLSKYSFSMYIMSV